MKKIMEPRPVEAESPVEIGPDGKLKLTRVGMDYLRENPKSRVHKMIADGLITEDGEIIPQGQVN
jgi:hypothetical protein